MDEPVKATAPEGWLDAPLLGEPRVSANEDFSLVVMQFCTKDSVASVLVGREGGERWARVHVPSDCALEERFVSDPPEGQKDKFDSVWRNLMESGARAANEMRKAANS